MTRDEVLLAEEAIRRLRGLQVALENAPTSPKLTLTFAGEPYTTPIRYPRELYTKILRGLIAAEERGLGDMGVEP